MQRVHISPALGKKPVDRVTTAQVEKLAEDMLATGLAPKSVRNVMTLPALDLRARDPQEVGDREPGPARDPSEATPSERR